jgi:hypothetical protein
MPAENRPNSRRSGAGKILGLIPREGEILVALEQVALMAVPIDAGVDAFWPAFPAERPRLRRHRRKQAERRNHQPDPSTHEPRPVRINPVLTIAADRADSETSL